MVKALPAFSPTHRYFPGTQSPHEEHLPKSGQGQRITESTRKGNKNRDANILLEWQAGVWLCTALDLQHLVSAQADNLNKVTVLHLSAEVEERSTVSTAEHTRSQTYHEELGEETA